MKENQEQNGLVQAGIWLLGEFGELLVGADTVDLEGNPASVSENEVVSLIGSAMESFANTTNPEKRSDVIVEYGLTALSKLTVRFRSTLGEIKQLLDEYTSSNNVEIQQRACEYIQLFDPKWDPHRLGIFEPMPFKGNENMLEDYSNRAALGQDDEDDELPKRQVKAEEKRVAAAPVKTNIDDIFGILGDPV